MSCEQQLWQLCGCVQSLSISTELLVPVRLLSNVLITEKAFVGGRSSGVRGQEQEVDTEPGRRGPTKDTPWPSVSASTMSSHDHQAAAYFLVCKLVANFSNLYLEMDWDNHSFNLAKSIAYITIVLLFVNYPCVHLILCTWRPAYCFPAFLLSVEDKEDCPFSSKFKQFQEPRHKQYFNF